MLGLELIRYFSKSALILSPTVVIQHQWAERFEKMFLPDTTNAHEYISFNLHTPSLITSITYQGLYAAWNKITDTIETDGSPEEVLAYNGFDLLAAIQNAGIGTICLDEAHHLKTAWQKALYEFLSTIKDDCTIISLTATPPYDSSSQEWARYCSVCGEIDAEIPVPELVQQGILCPHQDFIYFNYPTMDEESVLLHFRHRSSLCTEEVINSPLFSRVLQKSKIIEENTEIAPWQYTHVKGMQALLVLAAHKGISFPASTARHFFLKGRIPAFSMEYAQAAFQFIIDTPDIFGKELVNELRTQLAQAGLLQHKNVCLLSDPSLARQLTNSSAKLQSIAHIMQAEQANLNTNLRMLCLTDFVGRDMLPALGNNTTLLNLDAVSVFETLRRNATPSTSIAILTGSLIVLPNQAMPQLQLLCTKHNVTFASAGLPGIAYHEILFNSNNQQKVAIVTELFQSGHLHIIVSTKALLGEGWDSPCINSLVLVSYVGSFVSSNQMRGRAIRKDPNNVNKVANIWHLATILPPLKHEDGLQPSSISDDFTLLTRRFESFLAPSYHGDTIENGIGRIDILTPPYDSIVPDEMNRQMLTLAKNREQTAQSWQNALPQNTTPEILDVALLPYESAPPKFIFTNVMRACLLSAGLSSIIGFMWNLPNFFWSWKSYLLAGAACVAATGVLLRGYYLLLRLFSPKKYIYSLGQSLLCTLKSLGEITSPDAQLLIQSDTFGIGFNCALSGGTLKEKKLFTQALAEMFSPFDSPRYLLIRQKRFLFWRWNHYQTSFACPSIIGNHRKRIDSFQQQLKKRVGSFIALFTTNARQEHLNCLKHSYINKNGNYIQNKRLVKRMYSAQNIAKGTTQKSLAKIKQFIKSLLPG